MRMVTWIPVRTELPSKTHTRFLTKSCGINPQIRAWSVIHLPSSLPYFLPELLLSLLTSLHVFTPAPFLPLLPATRLIFEKGKRDPSIPCLPVHLDKSRAWARPQAPVSFSHLVLWLLKLTMSEPPWPASSSQLPASCPAQSLWCPLRLGPRAPHHPCQCLFRGRSCPPFSTKLELFYSHRSQFIYCVIIWLIFSTQIYNSVMEGLCLSCWALYPSMPSTHQTHSRWSIFAKRVSIFLCYYMVFTDII